MQLGKMSDDEDEKPKSRQNNDIPSDDDNSKGASFKGNSSPFKKGILYFYSYLFFQRFHILIIL